jgi:inner membrane protein involved in colicin E2 resistance
MVPNQFFKVVGEIVQTAFSNGSESTFQSVRWNCSCILSLLFTTPVAFYQLSSCVVVYVFALGRQMILSLVFNIIKKTASLWVASFWHISLSLSLYIYIYVCVCVCVCIAWTFVVSPPSICNPDDIYLIQTEAQKVKGLVWTTVPAPSWFARFPREISMNRREW